MFDYDPEQVSHLIELGLGEQDAIDCLRATNNDIPKAADLYYSGGLNEWRQKNTWDEGAFHRDRYDNSLEPLEPLTGWGSQNLNVNNPPHYSIQGPDVLTPDVLGGPPRTRPSSPMNAGLDAGTNQSADIARAIQMSLEHDDYTTSWGHQETGITGTHSTPTATYFGPATRESYEESRWALTTTVPVTHEIYLDPAHPSDRHRKEGEPAFFKPSSEGFHLGPALAILHSIPAAREAFLATEHIIDDYGYNERWWSGEKIEASRITNIIETDGTDEMTAAPDPSEVVTEVQRLMAFLDRTVRGYGSVDSLAKIPDVNEDQQGDQLATFFRKWDKDIKQLSNWDGKSELKPFSSIAVETNAKGETVHNNPFQVLKVGLSPELLKTPGSTLYNAIDRVIWADEEGYTGDKEGYNGDIFLQQVSDVFCIALHRETNDEGGVNLDIPTDLYLTRYTAEFLDIARNLKVERERIKEEIEQLEKRQERLLRCRKSQAIVDTSTVETTKLIEAAIAHFQYLKLPSDEQQSVSDDVPMETEGKEHDRFVSMIQNLQGVLDKLKVRLAELAESKKKAQNTLHELTKAFTSPETTSKEVPPLTKHSLRGVFIDLSTTFIKIRTDSQQSISTEEWWCLSYPLQWADANTSAYKVMKADEKEVLDAVKYTGEGKALLIYATEEAMQPREMDGKLPEPLKKFVENDNVAFLQELETAGDKGKRKRNSSTWWGNNNHSRPIPRISIDDPSSAIDGDPGPSTGVHQPPTSPTDFIDAAGSPIASPSSPNGRPQKKSPEEEEWFAHAQEGFTGDLGGQGTPHTAGRHSSWMESGWERMDEGATGQEIKENDTAEEVTERRYDGNFVARNMSSFDRQPGDLGKGPVEMGFVRIDGEEEDEEMKDAQHVEYVDVSKEVTTDSSTATPGRSGSKGTTL